MVLADVANGPAILLAGLVLGGSSLLFVIVVEAVVLRLLRWGTFWRSLRDSLIANVASALVGLLLGYMGLAIGSKALSPIWLLTAAFALSVVIEAGVLKLLAADTRRKIWITALVMNLASYLLLGPFFWVIFRGG